MNRYMSYQYSNNNYTYSSPITTTTPTTSSSMLKGQTTTNFRDKYPTHHTSSRGHFKTSELPWSSSLASSSRYPLSTAATCKSGSNPSTSNTTTTTANAHNSNKYTCSPFSTANKGGSTSTATSRKPQTGRYVTSTKDYSTSIPVTSTTISGRSLFDYTSPKTALNTPSSRIYDGQLRRTVTVARYANNNRNNNDYEDESKLSSSSSLSSSKKPSTTTANSASLISKTATKSSASKQQTVPDVCKVRNEHQTSFVSKPFRSSSLKLRASYTNILDQLATTTLAKLKLGSSNSNEQYSRVNSGNSTNSRNRIVEQ